MLTIKLKKIENTNIWLIEDEEGYFLYLITFIDGEPIFFEAVEAEGETE